MFKNYLKTAWRNIIRNKTTTLINLFGLSVALGKQLKWPDDYFSLIYTLNFTRYRLMN